MGEVQTLSQGRIATFLACRRRFQLRYIQQLDWPTPPLDEPAAQAQYLGQRFHQLLQRHFLGLPVDEETAAAPELHQWWQAFKTEGPTLPAGRPLPEISLTVPIDGLLLTGRFDLLVLGEERIDLFDWKTDARPRPEAVLRQELQTRLYLALAAEGSRALEHTVEPEGVRLTYWYANEPAAAVTIVYDRTWHTQNWADLGQIAADIKKRMSKQEIWPLTDDLSECRRCAYQIICGRQMDALDLSEWERPAEPSPLEPEIP